MVLMTIMWLMIMTIIIMLTVIHQDAECSKSIADPDKPWAEVD